MLISRNRLHQLFKGLGIAAALEQHQLDQRRLIHTHTVGTRDTHPDRQGIQKPLDESGVTVNT
ncbi:hypothetical protein D3C78_1107340 [compost metagenome]